MDASAFDRRIFIIQPKEMELGPDGEMVPVAGAQEIQYPIWAYWKESLGSEGVSEEQEFGRDSIEVVFWWNPIFASMDTTWKCMSETGQLLDIASVVEAVPGKRNWQIKLRLVRRV